jgi:hypothetical protein
MSAVSLARCWTDGQRIDYVGGNINFVGQGYKLEAGDNDDGRYDIPRRVLFRLARRWLSARSSTVGSRLDEQYSCFSRTWTSAGG